MEAAPMTKRLQITLVSIGRPTQSALVTLTRSAGATNRWSASTTAEQAAARVTHVDRKSTRLNSSHMSISYAVFCLKKKKKILISYSSYTLILLVGLILLYVIYTFYNLLLLSLIALY